MKIAISSDTENGLEAQVSSHFGRCPYFTIVEMENGEVKNLEIVKNPFFDSHGQPGQLPEFIKNLGVEIVVAGGIGQRAIVYFEKLGIKTITGVSGKIKDILKLI
ncbi:NifB/NifX family molybdenum-iron cluster-binding protein [bacterium]|nr:NifB/NifX family molybdenum-iron cluster-binding protein [bacterium]